MSKLDKDAIKISLNTIEELKNHLKNLALAIGMQQLKYNGFYKCKSSETGQKYWYELTDKSLMVSV